MRRCCCSVTFEVSFVWTKHFTFTWDESFIINMVVVDRHYTIFLCNDVMMDIGLKSAEKKRRACFLNFLILLQQQLRQQKRGENNNKEHQASCQNSGSYFAAGRELLYILSPPPPLGHFFWNFFSLSLSLLPFFASWMTLVIMHVLTSEWWYEFRLNLRPYVCVCARWEREKKWWNYGVIYACRYQSNDPTYKWFQRPMH